MPIALRRPNWEMWRHTPVAKLWEVVALSCDLEPDCLIQRGDPRGYVEAKSGDPLFNEAFLHQDVIEFQKRLEIAKRNVWQGGDLRVTEASSKDVNFKVRFSDFAEFASVTGWATPVDFPGKKNDSSGERIMHKQKAPLQEQAVLRELTTLAFDAKALPRRGAKAAVWQRLRSNKNLFQSRKVFDRAWERLRQDRRISNS